MKWWTKILPFFFVEWYAKNKMERFNDKDGQYVYPFEKVKIYISFTWEN